MFNRDTWSEIWIALKQNKLRTALTGFAISWGIFMLVLLSSVGVGFKNSVMEKFESENKNSFKIWAGETSIPYKGNAANRFIHFTDKDWDIIRNNPNVDELSPETRTQSLGTRNDGTASLQLLGVKPIYAEIQNVELQSGRFINESDILNEDKVVVISQQVINKLFKPNEQVLGSYIYVNSLPFKVIGTFSDQRQEMNVYAPFDVVKKMYHVTQYWQISFTTKGIYSVAQNQEFQEHLFQTLARYHEVSPDDKKTFYMSSTIENMKQVRVITMAIQTFIWIIGIAMLISGVVGVGNIMLVTVKERTNEIGIRKALGAKPSHILFSIVMESLVITVLFGLIGMLLAVILTTVFSVVAAAAGDTMSMFQPSLNLATAFGSLFVMIISGVLAGFFPARKAVKIKPIEAIQYR